jgi:hypothetical protein
MGRSVIDGEEFDVWRKSEGSNGAMYDWVTLEKYYYTNVIVDNPYQTELMEDLRRSRYESW